MKEPVYGLHTTKEINDAAYTYTSGIIKNSDDPLLKQILYCKGKQDTLCCRALQELMYLCVADDSIFRYVYTMEPYSYQYARFSDWFLTYTLDQKKSVEKYIRTNPNVSSFYQNRLSIITEILKLNVEFKKKCSEFEKEQEEAAIKNDAECFKYNDETWMAYKHPEVIKHWPPKYIVGRQIGEATELLVKNHPLVNIKLEEVTCEWMYSNPTGHFNLSATSKPLKITEHGFQVITYERFKKEQAQESGEEPQIDIRNWRELKRHDPVLLRLIFDDVALQVMSKIHVTLKVADNEKKNVND